MIKRNDQSEVKRSELKYAVMDATNLSIETGTFDVVFDKSTIDCLMCAKDRPKLLTSKMLKESQRVLKTGGLYIAISFGPPDQRAYLLKQKFLSWEVEQIELPHNANMNNKMIDEEDNHFIYVCKKLPGAD